MDFTSQIKNYLSGDVILYYIIGFILLENVFELYLIMRQVSTFGTILMFRLHSPVSPFFRFISFCLTKSHMNPSHCFQTFFVLDSIPE